MVSKKKVIVVAGVAVAATAAAVVVRGLGSPRRTYQVSPIDEGWVVAATGSSAALSTHATKKEALEAARALAREKAPSRLVIQRLDGTVQAEHSYDVEG